MYILTYKDTVGVIYKNHMYIGSKKYPADDPIVFEDDYYYIRRLLQRRKDQHHYRTHAEIIASKECFAINLLAEHEPSSYDLIIKTDCEKALLHIAKYGGTKYQWVLIKHPVWQIRWTVARYGTPQMRTKLNKDKDQTVQDAVNEIYVN